MFSSFVCSSTASRRMARPAAACLAALLILAPACSHAESSKPAAPVTAAPAPAEPTASHLAAARELVLVSGMNRSFDAVIPQLIKHLSSTYAQTRPDLEPDLDNVMKALEPEFQKHTDELVDKAAHIFAKLMTEQEIQAAVVFFKSEPGKKYVQSQPYFFDDVVNAMQDWRERIEAQLLIRVRAELKKKGHTL